MTSISIKIDKAGHGKIYIDGHEIKCCRSIEVSAGVDQATHVTLTLVTDKLDLESEDVLLSLANYGRDA